MRDKKEKVPRSTGHERVAHRLNVLCAGLGHVLAKNKLRGREGPQDHLHARLPLAHGPNGAVRAEDVIRIVESKWRVVVCERRHLVDGASDGGPRAAVAPDAPRVAQAGAAAVVERGVGRRVPAIPSAQVKVYGHARLVQAVAPAAIVGKGDFMFLRPAARVDFQPRRASGHHPCRILRLVAVAAGRVVLVRAALASAAARVQAELQVRRGAGRHGLRAHPVAQRLHPLRELFEVLVDGAIGVPALQPSFVDVGVHIALCGEARVEQRLRIGADEGVGDLRAVGRRVPRRPALARRAAHAVVVRAGQRKEAEETPHFWARRHQHCQQACFRLSQFQSSLPLPFSPPSASPCPASLAWRRGEDACTAGGSSACDVL